MNIIYLDADIREIIKVVDYPECPSYDKAMIHRAKEFAAKFDAKIIRTVPQHDPNEWTVELEIPLTVRRKHTPLPGDRVSFRAIVGICEHEVTGIYQHKCRESYVILDECGGRWEVQSMWQMKKQSRRTASQKGLLAI